MASLAATEAALNSKGGTPFRPRIGLI